MCPELDNGSWNKRMNTVAEEAGKWRKHCWFTRHLTVQGRRSSILYRLGFAWKQKSGSGAVRCVNWSSWSSGNSWLVGEAGVLVSVVCFIICWLHEQLFSLRCGNTYCFESEQSGYIWFFTSCDINSSNQHHVFNCLASVCIPALLLLDVMPRLTLRKLNFNFPDWILPIIYSNNFNKSITKHCRKKTNQPCQKLVCKR